MLQELLDAYWNVEGLTFKEAADRRGVNRGPLYRICKTSIISRYLLWQDTSKNYQLVGV